MRSKKTLYNISTHLILQVIVLVYGFIVPKIIISHFGSNVNGLIISITQFLGYIVLLESGFGPVVKSALYKPIANRDNNKISNILKTSEKFFRNISFIFIIYIILLCIFYPFIVSKDFDCFFTSSLIVIISISTFAEYFFGITYRLFLQADQKSYIISIIQIITYVISIIIVIILAKIGASIHFIKLMSTIVFVFRPILQNMYVKKKYHISYENIEKNFELKQKWDGLIQHIAGVIHSNTDIIILTIFVSLSEVSVYSVYYLVVKGIKSIIQSFTSGIDAAFGDMIAKGEQENLKRKFNIYETLYDTVCTILFTCTMLLIVPFVTIYTKGITDTNYVRHSFGILLVISEYIWALRLPYSSITLAAGHFKETRKGAWMEAITNIVLSVLLVWKYGIIGVTIGTIVAMSIRTMEFIYHTNKYILNRSVWNSIKKIIIVLFETVLIYLICSHFHVTEYSNYFNWGINALCFAMVSTFINVFINIIFYKEYSNGLKNTVLKFILKKKTN